MDCRGCIALVFALSLAGQACWPKQVASIALLEPTKFFDRHHSWRIDRTQECPAEEVVCRKPPSVSGCRLSDRTKMSQKAIPVILCVLAKLSWAKKFSTKSSNVIEHMTNSRGNRLPWRFHFKLLFCTCTGLGSDYSSTFCSIQPLQCSKCSFVILWKKQTNNKTKQAVSSDILRKTRSKNLTGTICASVKKGTQKHTLAMAGIHKHRGCKLFSCCPVFTVPPTCAFVFILCWNVRWFCSKLQWEDHYIFVQTIKLNSFIPAESNECESALPFRTACCCQV